MNQKIAIIGMGKMGQAMAQALKAQDLILIERNSDTQRVSEAAALILAVKPQDMAQALKQYQHLINKDQLVISIAAGVPLKTIAKYLSLKDISLVRVMPNLGVLVKESMSCWVKNKQVTDQQVKLLKLILNSFGKELELPDENILDKITPISGSGPAYFAYLAEILINSTIKMGLSSASANKLVIQTLIGTGEYLRKNPDSIALRESVSSKRGVTEAVIKHFRAKKFKKIIEDGVKSGLKRAKELAKSSKRR